jgi:hypothetical protein
LWFRFRLGWLRFRLRLFLRRRGRIFFPTGVELIDLDEVLAPLGLRHPIESGPDAEVHDPHDQQRRAEFTLLFLKALVASHFETRETLNVRRQTRCRRLGLFVLAAYLILAAQPVLALKIVEPAEGAKLTAGKTVTTNVDLGKDSGIIQVRYYWYGEQDDTLVEQEDATATGSIVAPVALIGLSDHNPPFGGPLLVPQNGIGPMRLLAVAEISRGRLGTRSIFDEIVVQIEPAATLTTIDFETDKPLQLGRAGQSSAFGHVDSLGKIFELPVVGEFTDGVTRRISSPASGTSYKSSNDRVTS